MMGRTKKEMSFENALERLQEIVQNMEESDLSLEESLKLFQEGMNLSQLCNKKLDEAERKVSVVMKNANGEITEENFEAEEE